MEVPRVRIEKTFLREYGMLRGRVMPVYNVPTEYVLPNHILESRSWPSWTLSSVHGGALGGRSGAWGC